MKKIYLLLLVSILSLNVVAQVTTTESFDGTTFAPSGWTNSNSGYCYRVTTGVNPTCTTHSGAGMVSWDNWTNCTSGILTTPVITYAGRGAATPTVTVWFWRDGASYNTASYNSEGVTIYVNTSPTTAGATSLGFVPRRRGLAATGFASSSGAAAPASNGWYSYTFNIPAAFNTATNYILFSGFSQCGEYQYMDDVSWQSYPLSCSGTPTAGTVSASATSGCGTFSSNLSLSGTTSAAGITYQWQTSPDNSTWTNVGSATNATYSATVTSSIYYRAVIGCSNSGLSANTSGVLLTSNAAPAAITGSPSVCPGTATTLADVTAGGTWTSNNTSVATVGASTGIVTGATVGNVLISYTLASGCRSTQSVIVSPTPPISVSASPSTYCSGNSSNLTATSSVSNYSVYTGTYAPVSFTPTATFTNASTPTSGSNDQGYYSVTLPFDFTIYGVTYTAGSTIYIGTNGYLSFSTGYTSDYINSMPNSSFTALISVFGRDMNLYAAPAGLAITYGTTGTTPNRKFVVNFNNVDYGTTNIENGQIVLNETSGIVELHVTTAQPTQHTLGIQNATGSVAAIVPGQNLSTTAITNSSWLFIWPQATSYTWTPATGLSNTAISNPVTTTTTTVTYTVAGTFNGCSATASTVVSVNPSTAAITGTLSACVGGTSALADATSGGAWTSSNSGIASVNSSGLVSAVAVGTATITYSSSGCFSTAVFTVNAAPGAITGTMTVCTGLTTSLANSGGTGAWTSSNTSAATVGASTGVVSGVSAGTSTISYLNGCGSYITTVVTVNQTPAAITGSSTACPATTTTLADANSGGAWTSSNTSIATVGGANGVVTGVAAGTVTITYNLGNGCAVATNAMTVNLAPFGLALSPASSATICQGNSYALTASTITTVNVVAQDWNSGMTGATGGTWTITNNAGTATSFWQIWSSPGYNSITPGDGTALMEAAADATGSGINTNTILTSPSFSLANYSAATLTLNQYCYSSSSYDFTVAIEYSTNGGSSWTTLNNQFNLITGTTSWSAASPTTTITMPAAAMGQSNVMIRFNYNSTWGFYWAIDNIKIVGSYPATTGFVWAGISGASGLSCTSCAATTVTPTATGANVYSVTATNIFGCTSTTGATLNVNPSPAAITGTLSACVGGTSTLSSATGAGAWSSTNPGIATIGAANGVVSAGVSVGTTTISYTVSGCAATATFAVNAAPGAITGTGVLCTGTTTTLANSGGAGTWTSANTPVATVGSGTGIVTGVTAGTATISYINGCSVYVTTVVTVNQTPAAITGSSTTCLGSTTTLASATTGGTWSSGTTSVGTITPSTGIVSPVAAGTTTISYTLGNGCAAATRAQSVNPVPPAVTITPGTSATICLGASSSFTATTAPTVNVLVQDWNSGMTGTTGGTWAITNLSGTSTSYWQLYSSPGYSSATPGDGTTLMEAAPDSYTGNTNSIVTSPSFSLAGLSAATLTLNQYCFSSSSYDITVAIEYSTDGGGSWSTLNNQFNLTTGTTSWSAATPTTTIAMPAGTLGMSNVMIRFNYNSTWGFYWAIDNIKIVGTYTVPTYTWAGVSGATGLSCTSCTATTITPAATGSNVYSITATANGCSSTNGVTVSVNPLPTAAPTNSGAICNTGTVTLSANPAGGASVFTWSGSSLTATTGSSTTATPTSNAIYSLTVTNGSGNPGCSPATIYTTAVTVNAKPTAAPTNSSPLCNGGTLTLTANPGGSTNTYVWSGANLLSTTAANPTATPTTTSTYSLTVTNGTAGSGCSSSYTTTATVNPTPTAAPTNGGPICNGGSTTLTANPGGGATTYAWSGPNLSSAVVANPTASPTTTTTYSLTVTNGTAASGCNPTTVYTTTVTVNPTPTAAPTNNSPICNGGNVSLTANPGGGAITYLWSGPNLSSTTAQNPTAVPTVTSTYSLTVTNGTAVSGCAPSTIYTTSVTVNSTPTAAPTNSGVICNGGTVTLMANPGGTANTYSWSGPNLLSTTAQNPTATPTATATYSLTVTNGTANPGCTPATIYTTTVTVNPTPVAAPTNNGHICINGTVNLTANPAGGATVFTWSGANLIAGNIANTTATPTVTGTYSLTVSDGSGNPGCSPSTIYTTSVTVNAIPVATPTNSSPICVGGNVTLTANPAGGANTYTWSGSSLSASTAQNPTAAPIATEVYSLVVSDGSGHSGCSPATIYTTSVTVNPAPSLTSATNDGPICAGTTLNLAANGAANVTGYQWAGPVVITNATTANASIPSATTAANGVYTVTINNNTGSGCTATYTTSATVNPFPSVASITPSTTNMCVNAPLTLTAGATTGGGTVSSYNWSGPNGYSTTTAGNTATIANVSLAAAGSYTLSVTYPGTGCTSNPVTSASVTINNLPTVSSINVSPTVLCANNPITMTGAGAAGTGSFISYNWSGPNGYSSTSASSVQTYTVPSAAASGVYSLSVTYTGTGCTSAKVASNTLTVNALPTAYTINGGGFYCSGGSGVHVGLDNSEIGVNYQLYNGATAQGVPVAGTGVALDFGLQTAAGTYSVYATNATTSCGNSMTGTTTVSVGPVPSVYSVTGGGNYCAGGTGVHIGLASSDATVGYQLYRGATPIGSIVTGTGSPVDFGLFTTAGTYTVVANPAATCAANMNGSATVGINPLPTQYNVTGGGAYCAGGAGVHIGLDWGVSGVSYQLYRGATSVGVPVGGAASGLDFGLITTAGTYSVVATNTSTNCVNNMTGSVAVTVNPTPTVYAVTGGGNYCAGSSGSPVGLASSNSGINYQLYLGSSTVGGPVSGTGSSISFGNQPTAGTYTVTATNATTLCTSAMSGNATVGINAAPATFTVTGGGSYCAGGTGRLVGLNGSASGVNYQLYNGGSTVGGLVAGTGAALNFGLQTAAGTYTVLATITATSCSGSMNSSATISIDPLPTAYAVTGGGVYCNGGTGVAVGLGNSAVGINYQLYRGATSIGSPVAGTGSAISFGNQTIAGTYSVLATNAGTSCTNAMSGSAVIGVNPMPVVYNMTGGGNYCIGGAGVNVGLSSSTAGINYQLYLGATAIGAPQTGSGTGLDFGTQITAGTYTVQATNATTGCTLGMSGSSVVSINALPTVFNMSGGGSYCAGGSGLPVGLAGSASGDIYQLYRGSTPVSATVAGTGAAISFGSQTTAGTYTVMATTTGTGCTNNMGGTASISVNPLPAAFVVGGGGAYCSGGSGVIVNLSSSTVGVNYQLYQGSTAVGSPVTGSGSAIDFGLQSAAGTYSVSAINTSSTCTNGMSGTATISINALPTVYTVTGGGSYCSGGSGVTVGLSNSQAGVNYQLYRGVATVGSPVAGTGSALSFGVISTIGAYSVVATNSATGCVSNMTGSATVSVNAVPTVYNVTGGGNYCAGGTGVSIGTNNSATGVNYQLFQGATAMGSPVAGSNGVALNFGTFTTAGSYSVMATTASTGCAIAMNGSAAININPLPSTFTVTGGGAYCSGGTGVTVGLSGSTVGINYQLYSGITPVGSAVAGSGSALAFGNFTANGTYTVGATNATTSCTNNMTGSATISINALPTTFNVTGGGNFCSGGAGVAVGLNGSTSGVNYQLYNGSSPVGSVVAGTGSTLNFGTFSTVGVYTVSAANASTGCAGNMTGSASISINALPTVANVYGGGSYCNGGVGVNVGLDGTTSGVNYQLYNGSTTVGSPAAGTGGPVNFGLQTAAGTYTVFATNASTGCVANMNSSATVVVNALPTAFTMVGGGSYCSGSSGVAVGLNGSTSGVNYQLFRGATAMSAQVPGTGAALTFGSQTAAGTYTVVATNASTTCTSNMTGTANVSINATPSVFSVTGGGSYCTGGSGVTVGLNSSATGVNYRLYNGSIAVGSAVPGTGLPINFGSQMAAGTYTVAATSATSTCGANMTGSAMVTVNSLPTAYTVVGGGVYCAGGSGVVVGLSNSANGINYQLYNGSSAVGVAMPGTGSGVSFGMQTNAGTYSVVATSASSGCVNNMTGTVGVSINAQPVAYNVTGGGAFCASGTGVAVGLSGSNSGISYQLYKGSTASGSPVLGTGGAISFGNITAAGTYSVVASNVTSGCTNAMNGTAGVIVNPTPSAYVVNGGGNYCAGGVGVTVGLTGSSAGINYQLYNGSALAGMPVAGTGGAIDFGLQMATGTYTVLATDATTLCAAGMIGNTSVGINALPVVYTVTGGGNYCAGGTGSVVGLGSSETGVTYQLYRGGTAVGSLLPGTGSALSFGPQLTAGTYSVAATNTSGCNSNMSGTVSININALPAVYAVGGGGNYCAGGAGVNVTLTGSNTGINYRLFNGSSAIGLVAGTGSAISFGLQSAAGTYTVQAVNSGTGCVRNMTGSTAVVVNAQPTAYTVTGGGNYCSGGSGVVIGLGNSNSGISYQLYNSTTAVSTPVAGTGSSLSFGAQTGTGAYTVLATNTLTGCTNTMTGTATIGVNALPVAYTVNGGGNYCADGTGVNVTLGNSASGVEYQLYNGSSPVGSTVIGTGSGISFGPQTAAGSYSVMATNPSTGCSGDMAGTVSVMINSLPTAYNVTGGGSYCSGGSGVAIGLDNTASGATYQLYNGTTAVGTAIAGTGSAITFGQQTTGGSYNVVATTTATGCTATMTGTTIISANAAPTAYIVSGGGNYCAGGAGVHVLLSGSNTGILYQVYRDATPIGSPVTGTGSNLDLGAVFATGTYTVLATNAATSCTSNMTGSAAANLNATPTVYSVTGGGNYCAGSGGAAIGLNNSQSGVAYQLYMGTTAIGSPVSGTGSAIGFGLQPAVGTYTVSATNSSTGCNAAMSGIATVAVSPLPALYTVTGGGNYCAGTAGVHVGLSGSSTTDHYQLYNGAAAVGTPVAGTGTSIDFGVLNTTGTYSVVALNSTMTCGRNMTGAVTVGVNALPSVFAINGGGSYCAGGTGINVGMANSATGINYQLYNGAALVGSPVAGTGAALDFGLQTANGTYTVMATNATTGCSRSMSGTSMVSANALPSAYTVTGGGSYCESGSGISVGLGGSTSGINYRLYTAGSPMGAAVPGTGSAISFGLQTVPGTYTVMATNASTTCTRTMTGSASVSITPSVLPTVSIAKSSTSDTICQGTAITFSATAVNGGTTPAYQWRVNGSVVGSGSAYSYAPANHDVVTANLTSSAACALPAVVTNSVTMTVNPTFTPVVAVMLSPTNTVCGGTSVTFSATASYGGTTPIYAWMKNGVNVGSGTTYSYVPANGDLVYCGMISNYACRTADNVTSTATHMVVNEPSVPVVTITANPGTNISKGQSVTFTALVANGGANPIYQWKLNGNAVAGATSFTYSGNNFANNDVVRCEVTSSGPCGGMMSFNTLTLGVSSVGVINVATASIDVNVMPNPNKGEFTVKGNLATTDDVEVTIEVVNMLGQTIYSNKVMANNGIINERIKLDNTLANGMYMLNLRSAGGSKVFHVVVEQ